MKKKPLIKISLIIITLLLLIVPFVGNPTVAFGWDEMICETGDFIPISIRGVWGSSSNDVFFVGDSGHIFHYDGSNCYTMLEGRPDEITMLYDVWGTSENDVFAVGGNFGEILHFNGIEWSLMRKTKEPQTLHGVWGYSPNDVFAVGQSGIILRFDGEEWSEMESPNDFWPLWGIWGSSPDNIFAVGHAGTVLHYDGISWTSMNLGSQALGTVLYNVWGSAGNDVYVVGESGRYVNQKAGIVYHYDGLNWSQVMLDFSFIDGLYLGKSLYGVWGSSDKNVFAVGGVLYEGGILNYNGDAWIEVESEIPSLLFDIWGSSLIDIYAVGFGYRILHSSESSIMTTSSSTIQSTTSTTCQEDDPCCIEEIYGEVSEGAELLRYFRDTVLNQTPEGRELIRLYYQWSPAIVRTMKADEDFMEDVRAMVDEILPLISEEVE